MKFSHLIIPVTCLVFSSCAAEFSILTSDVPHAVQNAFVAKYPAAQSPEWEVEKEDGRLVYEAEFKLDGKRKEAIFKPDGTFVKEE